MPEPILTHYRARRIFTADAGSPWAESPLVRGDTIVFAGSTAEAEQHAPIHAPSISATGCSSPASSKRTVI